MVWKQKNVNILRLERIWASKVWLNNLYIIQRVILLGLTVVLTGISLKTELRFKIYGRLKFWRKTSNFFVKIDQTANTQTDTTETATTETDVSQTAEHQPLTTNRWI